MKKILTTVFYLLGTLLGGGTIDPHSIQKAEEYADEEEKQKK